MTTLDESLHSKITELCQQGDSLAEGGDFRGALKQYHRSWNLLPEPKEEWDASTWILSAIGDAYFFLGEFENVIRALANALRCPNGLGNAFVHLRLGQSAFELGQMSRAKDELTRAYMGAGKDIFESEDAKYMAYLESVLQPMPGQEKL